MSKAILLFLLPMTFVYPAFAVNEADDNLKIYCVNEAPTPGMITSVLKIYSKDDQKYKVVGFSNGKRTQGKNSTRLEGWSSPKKWDTFDERFLVHSFKFCWRQVA